MTKEEYQRSLNRIEVENPDEVLLRELRKGYDRLRIIYMRHALRRVEGVGTRAIAHAIEPEPTEFDAKKADETLKELWRARKSLFGKMNQTSNRFHDCKSDAERAKVSDEIISIWNEILHLKAKIAHYEKNAELPDETGARFPLPNDSVGVMKKINSLRAQISQVKKQIDALGELQADDPERSRIEEREKRLRELRLYLGHAETRLKTFEK